MHNVIGFKIVGIFRIQLWIWSDGSGHDPIFSIDVRRVELEGIGEREILIPLNDSYLEAIGDYDSLSSTEDVEKFIIENT